MIPDSRTFASLREKSFCLRKYYSGRDFSAIAKRVALLDTHKSVILEIPHRKQNGNSDLCLNFELVVRKYWISILNSTKHFFALHISLSVFCTNHMKIKYKHRRYRPSLALLIIHLSWTACERVCVCAGEFLESIHLLEIKIDRYFIIVIKVLKVHTVRFWYNFDETKGTSVPAMFVGYFEHVCRFAGINEIKTKRRLLEVCLSFKIRSKSVLKNSIINYSFLSWSKSYNHWIF